MSSRRPFASAAQLIAATTVAMIAALLALVSATPAPAGTHRIASTTIAATSRHPDRRQHVSSRSHHSRRSSFRYRLCSLRRSGR